MERFRTLRGPTRGLLDGLLFALTLVGALWGLRVHLYLNLVLFIQQYLALILALGLAGTFIALKARRREPGDRVPWYDWLAAVVSLVVCGYVVVAYPRLVREAGIITPDKWLLGAIACLLVLEATRRVLGWPLVGLALLFILYARFSHLLPALLEAPSTNWDRLGIYLYLDGNSIFGLPLNVFSTIIIPFILFGVILQSVNADRFLTQAALAVMGRYRGGPAKVAVAGSSLFGTISGSAVSNVVIDGVITIPMMARAGYPSHVAAAIEALASTGGQIMPPVMGITAFLIADWLGIPYAQVVLAAIVPALLYYVALFVQVDLEAGKHGIVGLPAHELPRLRAVLCKGWVFFVPFAVLVYTLMVANWQPGAAGMAAVISAVAVGALSAETRPSLRKVAASFVTTGRTLLELVAIIAVSGLIIGALQVSGLAFSLALMLVSLAAGSLLVLLLLTAALSIVLGMGLPTSVIYILLAVLVAPGLVEFGVPALAAHLYLFYFGMMSVITPPVCFATFAAAAIARCDLWQAGWAGVRLGIAAYIIPFIFVYQPELLMIGSPVAIVLTVASALVAVTFIAAAVAGYLFAPLGIARRALLAVAGACLIPPPLGGPLALALNLGGLALGVIAVVGQRRQAARIGPAGGASIRPALRREMENEPWTG